MNNEFDYILQQWLEEGTWPHEQPGVSVAAPADLLIALELDLESQPGLIPLWAAELRRELTEALSKGA
jgi:hypothetical protein